MTGATQRDLLAATVDHDAVDPVHLGVEIFPGTDVMPLDSVVGTTFATAQVLEAGFGNILSEERLNGWFASDPESPRVSMVVRFEEGALLRDAEVFPVLGEDLRGGAETPLPSEELSTRAFQNPVKDGYYAGVIMHKGVIIEITSKHSIVQSPDALKAVVYP